MMATLPCRSQVGSAPPTPPPNACTVPCTAYDNNNEANLAKQQLKQHPPSTQPSGQGKYKPPRSSGVRLCTRIHLNSLWSVWYGFFGTFLQAYAAVKCTKRFLRYSVLPWGNLAAVWELHGCFVVTGLAVMLLPLFLASAVFKNRNEFFYFLLLVGNHANDGYKLGRGSAKLSSPTSNKPCGALWRHAGPTAAFLHLVIAVALLAPRLVMEARLVQHGFLPSDALWRTDLDFMVVHHDRLVVLSFMTAASPPGGHMGPNISTTPPPITHNHTVDAMALTMMNSSAPGVLEATVKRSLANDILEYLKDMFKMTEGDSHGIESHIEEGFGSTVSVEYLNYAIALLVYSVRYPAVFWSTNKCFGTIFSVQLLANSIQSLISFAGISVLYKVQVIGAYKALPLLNHYPKGASPLGGSVSPFLLNPHVTLALFALASFLVLASSMILYLYGHARYNSFLSSFKDRSAHITSMGPPSSNGGGWGYRTHGAALAALLASAVAQAPLLHDLTVVYRGSLDGAVLACIVVHISTLFLWVVVWLGLTIKYNWTFKITVTVGRATVRSARSVRLVTDVELAGRKSQGPNQTQPLLVVGNGRAYTVSEAQSRKAIMSVVQKTQQMKQQQQNHGINGGQSQSHSSTTSSHGGSECLDDDGEEQIYWLRPAGSSPQRSPDSVAGGPLCWGRSTSRSGIMKKKHKVTFNEASSTSQRSTGKAVDATGANGGVRIPDEDDGDYATLRELPLIPGAHRVSIVALPLPEDDCVSEEGKLLACVLDDNVTYASTSRDLIPPVDYEDPSPLLTPEPLDTTRKPNPVNVTVHNQLSTAQTPRCLRRADSGMPPEELTPRSDSISTESSSSPPEVPGSNHSETSSGVHSTASSNEQHLQSLPPGSRKASSVADLQQPQAQEVWKSCSLQRNVPPPGAAAANNSIYGTVKAGSSGVSSNQGLYGTIPVQEVTEHGIQAVILETGTDNTVVIRRKSAKPILDPTQIPVIREEPFSRSTNMKMTSFTEHNDLKNVQASSATLPHYPTQPQQSVTSYPHCSTMPLPHSSQNNAPSTNLAAGTSCNVYPRQHTTIPTHHNGVRLFPASNSQIQNHYVKRVQQNYQL